LHVAQQVHESECTKSDATQMISCMEGLRWWMTHYITCTLDMAAAVQVLCYKTIWSKQLLVLL
jgi:hypothetical protein